MLYIIPPLIERGLYCNHLVCLSICPSVHTFVTDISASTGRNEFILSLRLDLSCCLQVYKWVKSLALMLKKKSTKI